MTQKNLRLPADIALQLAADAKASGQSQGTIVASALTAYWNSPSEDGWRDSIEQRLSRLEEVANL